LIGVIKNMQKTKRQIISVHCGPSKEYEYCKNVHINIKTEKEWKKLLSKYFKIKEVITIQKDVRYLYLLEQKSKKV
ncbi:MAG: hypothetical protein ACOCP4_05240, partial [Candidatus Woesearchaeota archaeon]